MSTDNDNLNSDGNEIISPDGSVTPELEDRTRRIINLKNPKIIQFLKIVFPLLKKY